MNQLVLAYHLTKWGEAIRRKYVLPYQFEKAVLRSRGKLLQEALGKNRHRRRSEAGKERRKKSLEIRLAEIRWELGQRPDAENKRLLKARRAELRLALLRLDGFVVR